MVPLLAHAGPSQQIFPTRVSEDFVVQLWKVEHCYEQLGALKHS
jgi:hypothetical protein